MARVSCNIPLVAQYQEEQTQLAQMATFNRDQLLTSMARVSCNIPLVAQYQEEQTQLAQMAALNRD